MALLERIHDLTIPSALTQRATRDPEASFLLARDATLTYAEADSLSEALAASLANLGVEAGDRIALVLPACPEFAVTVFAAAKLGATVVPLNPRLTMAELQYMLRHSGAAFAVTAENAFGNDYLQLFEDLLEALPDLKYVVTVGRGGPLVRRPDLPVGGHAVRGKRPRLQRRASGPRRCLRDRLHGRDDRQAKGGRTHAAQPALCRRGNDRGR